MPIIAPGRIGSVATAYTAVVETDPRTEASSSSSSSSSSSEPSIRPIIIEQTRPIEQQRRRSPRLAETIPPATLEEDARGAIVVAGTAATDHPLLDERPGARPGRPRLDLTISSPQEQTRLRQQQQLARVQLAVQQDEGFQESPPIVEFSALDIRDGPVVSDPESGPEPGFELVSLPSSPTDLSARVPEGSLRDAEFASSQPTTLAPSPNRHQQDGDPPSELSSSPPSTTGPPSLLGSSTSFTPPAPPPSVSSSSGPNDPVLDSFLQAIHNQETAGGADFLRAQSDVYDRVIQTFFSCECDCKPLLLSSYPN